MNTAAESSSGDAPRWLTAAEQRAWRACLDGNLQLADHINRQLELDNGLTFAEYRILVMLSEAPGRALRMSGLANGVLSSRSRLTHQIHRMEQQGLVRRSSCADDGRGVIAELTDEGMYRLEKAAPSHVEDVRANFVDLMTPEELVVIAEVFEKVQRVLTERSR